MFSRKLTKFVAVGAAAILLAISQTIPVEFSVKSGDARSHYLLQAFPVSSQLVEKFEKDEEGLSEQVLERFQADKVGSVRARSHVVLSGNR